jgi:hypothetical protein
MFRAQTGPTLWAYIVGALALSGLLFLVLTVLPVRARKPLIVAVTFLAGLFYATEFFWPVTPVEINGKQVSQNFLTPYLKPVSDMATVLQGFAIGIGVYSLLSTHGKTVFRRRSGWGFSAVLLGAMVAMLVPALLKEVRPNHFNQGVFSLMYDGAFVNLNAAMFSIVAFYIVSAAYRAFRVRSREATILLASAFVIMVGQVALGQSLTNGIPNEGFAANFRAENLRSWILYKVNSPALLAVDLGLGIGTLATSLRLWLSLERGSYFDEEL